MQFFVLAINIREYGMITRIFVLTLLVAMSTGCSLKMVSTQGVVVTNATTDTADVFRNGEHHSTVHKGGTTTVAFPFVGQNMSIMFKPFVMSSDGKRVYIGVATQTFSVGMYSYDNSQHWEVYYYQPIREQWGVSR